MKMTAKKTALLGVMIALAFIFSYIEAMMPVSTGIPGAKLGLANLVVITALYTLGAAEAFFLSLVRILLAGMTFGNLTSMLYSLAGGMLSFLVMVIAKKVKLFSATGVSVLGGVSHNVGQILVAVIVLETETLLYYLPVLMLTGIMSGVAIGLLGALLIRRIDPIARQMKR